MKRPLLVAMEVLEYEEQECLDRCVQFHSTIPHVEHHGLQSEASALNHTSRQRSWLAVRGTVTQPHLTVTIMAQQCKALSPSTAQHPKGNVPLQGPAHQRQCHFSRPSYLKGNNAPLQCTAPQRPWHDSMCWKPM